MKFHGKLALICIRFYQWACDARKFTNIGNTIWSSPTSFTIAMNYWLVTFTCQSYPTSKMLFPIRVWSRCTESYACRKTFLGNKLIHHKCDRCAREPILDASSKTIELIHNRISYTLTISRIQVSPNNGTISWTILRVKLEELGVIFSGLVTVSVNVELNSSMNGLSLTVCDGCMLNPWD